MRILIIGGTRFIGPRVAGRLAAQGHSVTIVHRGVHIATLPPSVFVVRHPDLGLPIRRIPDELRRLEPEVVIHMMAMGEEDSVSAVEAFSGVARRIVAPSSGDVYKAYGILIGIESGPIVTTPLAEGATIRSTRYPYRRAETPPEALEFWYDKVLAEEGLRSDSRLPATILRLPKVYGPEDNGDLGTVYGFRNAPS
jgi:nucleoside-diphosphate-sugar epimerase